jgi:hypothetical protein
MTDSRLDPEYFANRRSSNGSIADNEDYSRRILKVCGVVNTPNRCQTNKVTGYQRMIIAAWRSRFLFCQGCLLPGTFYETSLHSTSHPSHRSNSSTISRNVPGTLTRVRPQIDSIWRLHCDSICNLIRVSPAGFACGRRLRRSGSAMWRSVVTSLVLYIW